MAAEKMPTAERTEKRRRRRRDFEGFVTFPGGDVAEGAAFGVGGGEDVVFITLPRYFRSRSRKRMNCEAVSAVSPICDDVDDGFFDFGGDQIDDGADLVGINVVEHEKAAAGAGAVGGEVVGVGLRAFCRAMLPRALPRCPGQSKLRSGCGNARRPD